MIPEHSMKADPLLRSQASTIVKRINPFRRVWTTGSVRMDAPPLRQQRKPGAAVQEQAKRRTRRQSSYGPDVRAASRLCIGNSQARDTAGLGRSVTDSQKRS